MVALAVTETPVSLEVTDALVGMDAMELTACVAPKEIRETLDAKDFPVFRASAARRVCRATSARKDLVVVKGCQEFQDQKVPTAKMDYR